MKVAELGSDEDDIDEEGQEYLEMLAKQAGEDGDDEDWEEDDAEETALEGYTTAVDDEDNLVDEYQIFKAILQSKTTSRWSLFSVNQMEIVQLDKFCATANLTLL